jgi:hypothetical protein
MVFIKKQVAWNKGLTKETDERVKKYSISQIGRQLSVEHRKKISEAHKGNHYVLRKHWKLSNEAKKNISEGHKGEKAYNWKGDYEGKVAMHRWVDSVKGKANHCEICGSNNKSRYHWANIGHTYKRVLEDYISMCPSCHKKYDNANKTRKIS